MNSGFQTLLTPGSRSGMAFPGRNFELQFFTLTAFSTLTARQAATANLP